MSVLPQSELMYLLIFFRFCTFPWSTFCMCWVCSASKAYFLCWSMERGRHKVLVHIYLESHSVCDLCPLVRIETPSPPLPLASEFPPTKGGGQTLACGWGGGAGGPNSDDWRKSLVLCLLCAGSDQRSPFICHLIFTRTTREPVWAALL